MTAPLRSTRQATAVSVLLSLLLLNPARVLAQCIDYSEYAHWLGAIDLPDVGGAVAVSGNHAFVADRDSGLVVVDLSTPAALEIVGREPVPGDALDITLAGNHAFIACGTTGISVVDITDPESPNLLATVGTNGKAEDIAVQGAFAYVAQSSGDALVVVDISDIGQPFVDGTASFAGNGNAIAATETYLYTATLSDSFQVFFLPQPGIPVHVAALLLPGAGEDVAMVGDHALVATGLAGLQAVDVSSPTSPFIAGQLSDRTETIDASGDDCYTTGFGTLAVDVTSPEAMTLGSRWLDGYAVDVAFFGELACIIGYDLRLVTLASPSAPSAKAEYTIPAEPDPDTYTEFEDLAVSPDRLYLAINTVWAPPYFYEADHHVRVYEITGSGALTYLGSSYSTDREVRTIAGNGSHVLLGYAGGDLGVVDLAAAPFTEVVPASTAGLNVSDIAFSGTRALLAAAGDLQILDMQTPSSPVIVGTAAIPGVAREVAVSGSLAFVAADQELYLANVDDPSAPVVLGSVALPAYGNDVATQGQHAYVACGWEGVVIVDAADPASPAIVATVPLPFYFRRVSVQDHTLYAGSYIWDVSDPAQPRVTGNAPIGGSAVSGERIFSTSNTVLSSAATQCAPAGLAAPLLPPASGGRHLAARPLPLRRGPLGITFDAGPGFTGPASVALYDVRGRNVVTLTRGEFGPGAHRLLWNGRDASGGRLGSGVYFLRLETPQGSTALKVPVIR